MNTIGSHHRIRLGRPQRRRGSIYLYVAVMSTIVSLIGLSALTVVRLRREMTQRSAHAIEARTYAQAAIRMGMHYIESDPAWRFNYTHGVWKTDIPIGNGTFTLLGEDTSDGDLADNAEDPLRLTGIGKRGGSIHKIQVHLAPANRGFTALKMAMHAGYDVTPMSGATINCDQRISANHDMSATSATINCDVQAVNAVLGSTYNGDTKIGIAPLTMPDTTDVFAWYLANGTTIDRTSLDIGWPNLLINPGLENGITDWTAYQSTVMLETNEIKSGASSGKVANRTAFDSGPYQWITDVIQQGRQYEVKAWAKTTSTGNRKIQLRVYLDSWSGVNNYQDLLIAELSMSLSSGWQQITGTFTPSWTGTLQQAKLRVRTDNGLDNYYVDDLEFRETGNHRTMSHKVLSPTSNPYGTPNANGIYILDMDNAEELYIKHTRIYGTLVLIEPKSNSEIGAGGPILLEPAAANLPVLLVKTNEITINPGSMGLSENALRVNFNPAGAPYNNETDADQSDTYASEIKGLIYSEKKITFKKNITIRGVVVSNDNIEVEGTFNLTHDNSYFLGPPPGFNAPEEIRILLNSASKPLN